MIIKDVLYGETDGVMLVEFGNGTVHLFNGGKNGVCDVMLKSGKPLPLGKIDTKKNYKGKLTANKLKPEVVLRFTNIESVDVFIDQLNDLKTLF